MERLIDKLCFVPNRILQQLVELLRTDKVIALYGGGVYAARLYPELKKMGILPDYLIVDDAYLTSVDARLQALPVRTPAQFGTEHPDSYVILAFDFGYEKAWTTKSSVQAKLSPETQIIAFDEYTFTEIDWISDQYIVQNILAFEKTFALLADPLSKRIMAEYLNARISGNAEVLMSLRTDAENDYEIKLILSAERDGAVIECGAFDGKSAREFDDACGGRHRIFAVEPQPDMYQKLCAAFADRPQITPVHAGVSSAEGTARIIGMDASAAIVPAECCDGSAGCIPITTIDRIAGDEPVFAITMDIEGCELDALKGAAQTIRRNHPVLAVRVYHRKEDLIDIPQYIDALFSGEQKYRIYLRKNQVTRGTYETTLYAL